MRYHYFFEGQIVVADLEIILCSRSNFLVRVQDLKETNYSDLVYYSD